VAGLGKKETALKIRHPVISVREALEKQWLGDLYLTQYRVEKDGVTLPKLARLRKEHAEQLLERGYRVMCDVRIADVDTTPKRKLSLEDRIKVASVLNRYGAAYYFTTHGFRVLQPLTRSLSHEELEVCLQRWFGILDLLIATMGVEDLRGADRNCKEWTRFFRMPKVVREIDGKNVNLWDTRVYNLDCPAVDPGDCTPPPKPKRHKGEALECLGTTHFGRVVLDRECTRVADAEDGQGTDALRSAAYSVGTLVGAGQIERDEALDALRCALSQRGYDPEDYEHTLTNCMAHGEANPRSLEPAVDWEQHTDSDGDISL
jgi:hypothetical protein